MIGDGRRGQVHEEDAGEFPHVPQVVEDDHKLAVPDSPVTHEENRPSRTDS
jgi:hypothetical protein